ncbi:aspartate aminotransferase [Lentzea waywayandensis]|uniref:Aspartate aminotransferase n=1 Tax=Lentzea waywayandensis TaxID=84724 RepID=A0A1I6DIS3_9PSEU|nr:hypothetical protein [Lentzea waywayandensis]SFR05334.1 aspartate aminotransferase [Lentzea waywayandensis]
MPADEHFGGDPEAPRFRVVTSLLYGRTTEQRWEAVRSADSVASPWIAENLGDPGPVFQKVCQ